MMTRKPSLSTTGLVSTMHDPNGRMVGHLNESLPHLLRLYPSITVLATPETSNKTVDTLNSFPLIVEQTGSSDIGASRRKVLSIAMDQSEHPYHHYCDMDRLIHWSLHYPEELIKTVIQSIQTTDFLVIGRTPEAFKTHPDAQIETETITNQVFSLVIGRFMDVTAGSCGLSQLAAEQILKFSQEPSNATDTEWPMIIHHHVRPALNMSYVEVNGLEYETPTFLGDEAYLQANTINNWIQRIKLSRASVEAVTRIAQQKPHSTPEDYNENQI